MDEGVSPDGAGLPMNGAAKASPPSVGIPDAAVEAELTPDGIACFRAMDASEQAIVRWLITLSPDWPFNGRDIAGMLLNGEHRDSDGSPKGGDGSSGSVHDGAGRETASPESSVAGLGKGEG